MDHPTLRFDRRFLAVAALLLAGAVLLAFGAAGTSGRALVVPLIALGIAAIVLAPLPMGTRGVVSAVMLGLATGIASVNLFAIGIFQGPITREFGWTQTQYAAVTLIGTLVTFASSLYIGRLFDRQGVRRWALISTTLFALLLISLYWLTNNLLHFYLVFAVVPILGAGTSSIAYSRVVARWFDQRRGQAFGAALAGIGIGGALLSPITQLLISSVGWRGAYVGLGLLALLITLPVIYWCLYDSPADRGLGLDGQPLKADGSVEAAKRAAPVLGFTATETRRQGRFWQMIFAFLLLAFAIGGVMLPLVPILRARGITPEQAALVQGALGLALIVGRAFAGFLMDRLFVPYVAAAILLFPIAGVALLAFGVTGSSAIVAAVCLGLAAGAELDVIAVLVSRYFGTRAYAENYGWQYAAWTLGAGTAPIVTNRVFDVTGSHTSILWVYAGLFALSALLVLRLGPYPALEAVTPPDGKGPAAAPQSD
ncbi:MAG: MFS transporter [Sinobacteraceae bacterium]|nr:MFS transporter [Nevskiaceae bacterium]MCP5359491.1 MFS transporter [Nevskiaceae bacterium]MCP5466834.1 MFS transporter [Nevskiaceae bacterium]MCP5470923.1 MFS transporter [Nevskiaceae bacterium]